jgi:hypothetical protein
MENMALYLRTFVRLLSSWVHGSDLRRFAVAVWLLVRDERDLNVDRARLRLECDLQLHSSA